MGKMFTKVMLIVSEKVANVKKLFQNCVKRRDEYERGKKYFDK